MNGNRAAGQVSVQRLLGKPSSFANEIHQLAPLGYRVSRSPPVTIIAVALSARCPRARCPAVHPATALALYRP
jgi:hypothetical protein